MGSLCAARVPQAGPSQPLRWKFQPRAEEQVSFLPIEAVPTCVPETGSCTVVAATLLSS